MERHFIIETMWTKRACQGTKTVGVWWDNPFVRLVAVVLLLAGLVAGVGPGRPDLGVADAALTRLFTPLSMPPGTYVVYRSPRPIAELTAALRALDPAPAPGAWEPTRPEAHDAFGQSGLYDRFRLAELFGGQRLTVVRGSLRREDVRLAYTLISPYPDPTLSRIESGTMVIVLTIGSVPGAVYNR